MSNDQWGKAPETNGSLPQQPVLGSQPTQQFGAPVSQPSAPQPTQQLPAYGVAPINPPAAPQYGAPTAPQWGQQPGLGGPGAPVPPAPKKSIPLWAWIVGGLVILGLVIGLIFALTKKKADPAPTPTTSPSVTSTSIKPTVSSSVKPTTTAPTSPKSTSTTSTKSAQLPVVTTKNLNDIQYPSTAGDYTAMGTPVTTNKEGFIDAQVYTKEGSKTIVAMRSTHDTSFLSQGIPAAVDKDKTRCGTVQGNTMCILNVPGGSIVALLQNDVTPAGMTAMQTFMNDMATKL